MRTLGGFCLALLLVAGLSAQNRSGFVTPIRGSTPSFGSVVFPGGASNLPGVQRTVGSVVHPGGGFPQIGVPGLPFRAINGNPARPFRNNAFNNGFAFPVAVPVYVPAYDPSMYGYYGAPAPQQPSQPNVIVIYPPAPQAAPVYAYPAPGDSSMSAAPASQQSQVQPQDEPEATHYLLAFKDHSIYSAVAYWVDGDTIHYMVTGNLHKQASVSSVDRELTQKLNESSGMEVKLPAAK